jgi:hypothetical protein
MKRIGILLLPAALIACGGDAKRPGRDTGDSADVSDVSADGSNLADASDTSTPAPDASNPDGSDATSPDTGSDAGSDAGLDTGGLGPYIEGCKSLFSARVAEYQLEKRPNFEKRCDVPLADDIGLLKQNGKPLCTKGESANACRDRLYDTPPAMSDLDPACLAGGNEPGCMQGAFLPRCADGTDTCSEDEVVCWDGTRPMIYAEAAASASTRWWIHMGGEGSPCTGTQCWLNYRYNIEEYRFAMSTLHPDRPSKAANKPGGVLSGDPALPYAAFNRIRFERCGDAASDAMETVPFADGVPPEYAASFPPEYPVATGISTTQVWHKGFNTWRATFRAMTTAAGRDLDGDGTPDMPSLANATQIVLSASSDASMWVTFAADRLADELRAIAGPDVDVRIAIDGMFPPMLDNEARYHPDAPADFNIFSRTYADIGLCLLEDNGDGLDNESCSDATYLPGGRIRDGYVSRGVLLDESCVAVHGRDSYHCWDRNYTLTHHVDVPILVLADQEDNTVSDGPPVYHEDPSYHWAGPEAYRKRVVDAAWDIVDFWGTSAREEEGPGAEGGFVLIMPKTRRNDEPWGRATHVRFGNDEEMARAMTFCNAQGNKLATASYNQMLGGWVNDALPQNFAIEDARRSLPGGNYWVTGTTCRTPE